MNENGDRALIRRCRSGDGAAFAELLANYEKPVFNAAYRMLGNSEDAADVSQSVFMKAFENLDSYDPQYRFFSWIYRMAINESINQLKRGRREQPLDDDPVAAVRNPEEAAQSGDLSREVQAGLMGLQNDYRTVMVLRHFADLSYREISDILQIPQKTVKSRLYSARQLLKESLQKRDLM